MRLKCPVAIAEQHRDRLALQVGRRQVQFPVAVEVTNDDGSTDRPRLRC
jgi:hypothetical protein